MTYRESYIEKRLVAGIRQLGGKAYKWVSPGTDGVPDRIVILPGGIIWFVELKADDGRLTPRQKHQLEYLEKLGQKTVVLRGMDDVASFLAARGQEVAPYAVHTT